MPCDPFVVPCQLVPQLFPANRAHTACLYSFRMYHCRCTRWKDPLEGSPDCIPMYDCETRLVEGAPSPNYPTDTSTGANRIVHAALTFLVRRITSHSVSSRTTPPSSQPPQQHQQQDLLRARTEPTTAAGEPQATAQQTSSRSLRDSAPSQNSNHRPPPSSIQQHHPQTIIDPPHFFDAPSP